MEDPRNNIYRDELNSKEEMAVELEWLRWKVSELERRIREIENGQMYTDSGHKGVGFKGLINSQER